jgi:hypothetical protein
MIYNAYYQMLKIDHSAGFFSCCTIRLEMILNYFNENRMLPDKVDSSMQFLQYKPLNNQDDITHIFFSKENEEDKEMDIKYETVVRTTDLNWEQQFSNFKILNYEKLAPFTRKYFALSQNVTGIVENMEKKYNFDYDNLCVIFHRGLSKCWETNLAPYHEYISKAREIMNNNKKVTFLLQSDETEFFIALTPVFSNVIILDEMCHISKEDVHKAPNVELALNPDIRINQELHFLSIVKIMSKAKTVITGSGNIAFWLCLLRGNADGVHQYLSPKEHIYGVKNDKYDPDKKDFWL